MLSVKKYLFLTAIVLPVLNAKGMERHPSARRLENLKKRAESLPLTVQKIYEKMAKGKLDQKDPFYVLLALDCNLLDNIERGRTEAVRWAVHNGANTDMTVQGLDLATWVRDSKFENRLEIALILSGQQRSPQISLPPDATEQDLQLAQSVDEYNLDLANQALGTGASPKARATNFGGQSLIDIVAERLGTKSNMYKLMSEYTALMQKPPPRPQFKQSSTDPLFRTHELRPWTVQEEK